MRASVSRLRCNLERKNKADVPLMRATQQCAVTSQQESHKVNHSTWFLSARSTCVCMGSLPGFLLQFKSISCRSKVLGSLTDFCFLNSITTCFVKSSTRMFWELYWHLEISVILRIEYQVCNMLQKLNAFTLLINTLTIKTLKNKALCSTWNSTWICVAKP